MMPRRIIRTISQLGAAALLMLTFVFYIDRNWRLLPARIHEYMPQHHTGLLIVDMTIATCSSLNVFSSCRLDPEVWHRIEKDLYLGETYFARAYIHTRRKKEEELESSDRLVIDVTVGRLDPGASQKGQADERWEARHGGLWIKRSAKPYASDSKSAVTAVDVLFGDDAVEAREGWAITGTPLLLNRRNGMPAHVTVRRGSNQDPYKPVKLQVKDNGRFKMVQLADLHLSTGVGTCRDALPSTWNGGKCEADPRTLEFVAKILEEEKPDLVVLSGDQVNGKTSPDAISAIFKYASVLIKHKIPYVSIFGNHDDEESLPRHAQMDIIQSLPYSLAVPGPEDIDGVGNYYVEVLARGGSGHSAITIYLLDSHSYSPDEKTSPGYDWIKKNQIDWFRNTAQGLKEKNTKYTHHHLDIAFIHIPLPEYRDPNITFVGNWSEPPTAPVLNSGFRDVLVEEGVVMLSCGHDHVNEYCALSRNENDKLALWMCYGGATGFGGYAGYGGFHRKIRVFEFDMNVASITTWKRVEWGETDKRIDMQVIVDAGHPVDPPADIISPPPPRDLTGLAWV